MRQPQYLYTYQGLNAFKLDIPLACSICPIAYLIPPPGLCECFEKEVHGVGGLDNG